jgi:hypothetical protein
MKLNFFQAASFFVMKEVYSSESLNRSLNTFKTSEHILCTVTQFPLKNDHLVHFLFEGVRVGRISSSDERPVVGVSSQTLSLLWLAEDRDRLDCVKVMSIEGTWERKLIYLTKYKKLNHLLSSFLSFL